MMNFALYVLAIYAGIGLYFTVRALVVFILRLRDKGKPRTRLG